MEVQRFKRLYAAISSCGVSTSMFSPDSKPVHGLDTDRT